MPDTATATAVIAILISLISCVMMLAGLLVVARNICALQDDVDDLADDVDRMTTRQAITHPYDEESAEWISDDYGYYHCSGCGYEQDGPETVSPYCPQCGARMESEEE